MIFVTWLLHALHHAMRRSSDNSNQTGMNVLFIHNNFPGQFKHLAHHLATQPNVRVAAIGAGNARPVKGVHLVKYALTDVDVSTSHPFARRFDME
jgi:hypothetical protein